MYPLICPVCGDDLEQAGRTFRCGNAHSFDIAREGYVNLLPGRARTPKIPGDSAPMLRARREFLDRGEYAPLACLVAGAAAEHLTAPGREDGIVAEIGCGEGYYIGRVQRILAERGNGRFRFFGMDRSRDAVRMAAKRYRDITFFAGDVWERVLFRDRSVRVLLDIFAPRNPDEFARVLEPGGLLLLVIPGGEHLAELRRELDLIGLESDKEERVLRKLSGDFRLARRRTLEYEMALESDELRALVGMSPSFHHVSGESLDRLSGRSMTVTASFIILELMRSQPESGTGPT